MICSRIAIPLLVAIAVSARCITAQAPTMCSASQAAVQQQFCKDCKTAVKCTSEGAAPVTISTCGAETACWLYTVSPGNSVAGCKTMATTLCKCSSDKICDAYDPVKSWICYKGALYSSTSCVPPLACSAGLCAAVTNTPSPITGVCRAEDESTFIYINSTCASGRFCMGEGTPYAIKDCGAKEYLDINSGDCIPAPPQPCADCVGACPDKTNCSNWHICGSPPPTLIDEQQCPEKQFFDATTGTCGTDVTKCSIETACNFATTITKSTVITTVTKSPITTTVKSSTTSPTVPVTSSTTSTTVPVTSSTTSTTVKRNTNMPATCTAANVGKSYEYPEDCKKYNACRLKTTTTYGYVVGSCSGSLVFNPTTSYCDLPANVPSCVPKTG